MTRFRRWFALFTLAALVALAASVPASPPAKDDGKPAPKWLVDRALTVSPAGEPVPALKYRLFPLSSARKDGNAVPIYLRLNQEQTDESKKYWREEPAKWNKLPVGQIPLKEAREFIKRFSRFYQQFDLGARRKTADWSYTLDQGSIVDILLPDSQQMRGYVPMLVLKARVEIAEGDYPAAIRSLETGFSFGQQVAEGPFLINGLVGIAISNIFSDVVPDLIERPDAPNLYWALTVMPRPFINLRNPMELEQRFVELQFPELADIDRPRTDEQWDALLVRYRKDVGRIFLASNEGTAKSSPYLPGRAPEDPAAKSPDLPAAKKYLVERAGLKSAEVEAMAPAHVLMIWILRYSREVFDSQFKASYIPYPRAQGLIAAHEKWLKAAPETEAKQLGGGLAAAIGKVMGAQTRIDRKIAVLRVIEALRLYAAANGGRLPDRLDQITEVPVPDDPGTDRPFQYAREGETATLTGLLPGEPQNLTGLRYTITLRK
jgi:hypothetical protein